MKLLKDKVNSSADATYPLGRIRDDEGDGYSGSQVDAEFMNDYVQCMEKIFAESGLIANGNPDNGANGYQLFEAFIKNIKLKKGYRVYFYEINQTGTSAPTLTQRSSDLNDTIPGISMSRSQQGQFSLNLPNQTLNKVTFNFTPTIELLNTPQTMPVVLYDAQVGTNVFFEIWNIGLGQTAPNQYDNFRAYIEIKIYD